MLVLIVVYTLSTRGFFTLLLCMAVRWVSRLINGLEHSIPSPNHVCRVCIGCYIAAISQKLSLPWFGDDVIRRMVDKRVHVVIRNIVHTTHPVADVNTWHHRVFTEVVFVEY